MTYAGARGDTRSQMRTTLKYPLTGHRLHQAFETIHDRLIPDNQQATTPTPTPTPTPSTETPERVRQIPVRVFDANKVWSQQGYPWRETYLSLLDQYYSAGFERVDFTSTPTTARERINEWVATITRDEITDLLPRGAIDRMTRLVLTNAVYFQALWQHQFLSNKTDSKPFTSLDGTTTRYR